MDRIYVRPILSDKIEKLSSLRLIDKTIGDGNFHGNYIHLPYVSHPPIEFVWDSFSNSMEAAEIIFWEPSSCHTLSLSLTKPLDDGPIQADYRFLTPHPLAGSIYASCCLSRRFRVDFGVPACCVALAILKFVMCNDLVVLCSNQRNRVVTHF